MKDYYFICKDCGYPSINPGWKIEGKWQSPVCNNCGGYSLDRVFEENKDKPPTHDTQETSSVPPPKREAPPSKRREQPIKESGDKP